MQLQTGTSLQNGKYVIIRVLGQGGFGITYEAEQVLLHKKVAVKEFFMKDCCERDSVTSQVSVGTGTQRDLVTKFRGKFIREAQILAEFKHPHIVRVLDVFEENNTAYYVMENLSGGSLSERIKEKGRFSESQAEKYICQIADALDYIHARNTTHLDVKPSNILLDEDGNAVLIDFGISKHYDSSGEQTSSTPVGISKGYAPLEQSREGDVSLFKPSTDIYALGATLYYLVSGMVPPEASILYEEGLQRPEGITDRIWHTIEGAMQPKRKDRPQNVAEFLALLRGQAEKTAQVDSEETRIIGKKEQKVEDKPIAKPQPTPKPVPKNEVAPAPKLEPSSEGASTKTLLWVLLGGLVVVGILLGVIFGGKKKPQPDNPVVQPDTTEISTPIQTETDSLTQPEQTVSGSVKVSSTPAGATIWLDGKNTKKTTPDILEDLIPGKHTIRLVLDGYNDYSSSVTITSGKRSDLSKTLTAKETPSEEQEQTRVRGQETISSNVHNNRGETIGDTKTENSISSEAIPFALVETKPTFQGGDANNFSFWVSQHLSYPEEARENAVMGRVTVQFTVRTDGSVSDVSVLHGVDPLLDNEALRVIRSSPKWAPGMHNGKKVNVTYTFPVIFQLK